MNNRAWRAPGPLAILACVAALGGGLGADPAPADSRPASPDATTVITPEAQPPDGVVLSVTYGPGQGDVILRWTGGVAPYTIYRSTDKTSVVAPGNWQGQTNSQAWLDLPPIGAVFFYKVTTPGRSRHTRES